MNIIDEKTRILKQKSLENILFALEIIHQAEDVTWSVLDSIDCDGEDRIFLLNVMYQLEKIMLAKAKGNFINVVREAIKTTRIHQMIWSCKLPMAV